MSTSMNRMFLERLMYFKDCAEAGVDALEERLKAAHAVCKACGASTDAVLSAELSEARTTRAYLTELLDSYWEAHNIGDGHDKKPG